jgi:hypothetical protein
VGAEGSRILGLLLLTLLLQFPDGKSGKDSHLEVQRIAIGSQAFVLHFLKMDARLCFSRNASLLAIALPRSK